MECYVFESGCGKWIQIDNDTKIIYTSDQSQATLFDYRHLLLAKQLFEEFLTYKSTLHAVAVHTNATPDMCPTVVEYLRQQRERVLNDLEDTYVNTD